MVNSPSSSTAHHSKRPQKPKFSIPALRSQFPILSKKNGGFLLIYLDNAATAQKPESVLNAMQKFYQESNANVHRGMHGLAERATQAYEGARKAVQTFLNAAHPEEIIFTKSCTESLNLVAKTWGRQCLKGKDTVVVSILEHHSNIVPWFQMKEENGLHLEWIDIDHTGSLRMDQYEEYLRKGNVKLVAITGQSNVLGCRPPLKEMIVKAHQAGALVLIDAAQLIAHHPIDVQDLDCDFLAFSGHKLYGPTGIGVLYGKRGLLENMPPWLGGGMMIGEVTQKGFTSADLPQKFEAGTPPIAEAIGLHAAIAWLSQFSWEDIVTHEQQLLEHACQVLSKIDGLNILPSCHGKHCRTTTHTSTPLDRNPDAPQRSGCLSFTLDGIHPHDLTDILGQQSICLRAGHHCTQPLHKRLGISASTRVSVALYNILEEIDRLPSAIEHARTLLRGHSKGHKAIR